jgi:hypothetical protein
MTWIYLILLSLACSVLYRIGGASTEDREEEFPWLPFKPWKARDVWCGVVTLLAGFLVGLRAPWWAWVLAFGLHWAALSTYWDFLYGYDNHWMHGFFIGLSFLPIMFFCEPTALMIRTFLVTVLMGGYSTLEGNATREELGRGVVMPITLAVVLWI